MKPLKSRLTFPLSIAIFWIISLPSLILLKGGSLWFGLAVQIAMFLVVVVLVKTLPRFLIIKHAYFASQIVLLTIGVSNIFGILPYKEATNMAMFTHLFVFLLPGYKLFEIIDDYISGS